MISSRCCLVFCLAPVAVAIAACAAHSQQPGKAEARGVLSRPSSSAPADSAAAATEDKHPLSYSGRGIVFMMGDGDLGFSPGDTMRAHSMGFDLCFDEEAAAALEKDELEPVDISGWLDLSYDMEASVLHVRARDDDGRSFEETYQVSPKDQAPSADFLAYVHSFFEYMHGEESEPEPPAAGGARECDGPECSCIALRCQCSICCKSRESVVCKCRDPDKCRCTCLSKHKFEFAVPVEPVTSP